MARPKGQPLVALLAILAGWMGGRVITWKPPTWDQDTTSAALPDAQPPGPTSGSAYGSLAVGPQSVPGMLPANYQPDYPPMMASSPSAYVGPAAYFAFPGQAWTSPQFVQAAMRRGRTPLAAMWDMMQSLETRATPAFAPLPGRYTGLERAAIETAPRFFAPGNLPDVNAASPALGPSPRPDQPRHWSMDAWALIRNDGAGALSPGVLPATYGGSQSGAVLRYRIDLSSAYRPSIYMRTTSALGGIRDNTLALGVSARPVPSVPVIAAVEGRMVDQASGRNIRPAALAYTEIAPIALPARLRAEVYLQGGYVGGRFATPFADGMVRVDRQLLRIGKAEARVGGGVWGGAQKGAARLDVGPSASLAMPLARGLYGRAALDWRFRMAGDAAPGSGPALTLSAGF